MPRRPLRPVLPALIILLLFMTLCRFFPALASPWLQAVILPVGKVLSAAASGVPFPLFEILLLSISAFVCADCLSAPLRCLFLRRLNPVRKTLLRILYSGMAILCGYILLWYPAYHAIPIPAKSAETAQIEQLCIRLIDRLNASDLRFPSMDQSIHIAQNAVSEYTGTSFSENTVKTAQYPEWMNFFGLSGLYSPWTGEAVLHPRLSPGERIFVAVHELMHRHGIADEGLANIHAWMACRRAGGEAALSADLIALRYAMADLRIQSEELWQACLWRMSPSLFETFREVGGYAFSAPQEGSVVRSLQVFLGVHRSLSDYSALVPWLADAFSATD